MPHDFYFQGYQGEYRISPDLGYYIDCQKSISLYISQLAAKETPIWKSNNHNCPIKDLPKSYEVSLFVFNAFIKDSDALNMQ